MNAILRKVAADTARKQTAALTAVGINLPDSTVELLARLESLEAMRPDTVEQTDLVDAYIAGHNNKQISPLASQIATYASRVDAWTEARIRLGKMISADLTANGDQITTGLATIAGPLIQKMNDAAQLDTLDTTALIRAGRTAEAEIAARVDILAGELNDLYVVRDRITKGAEYGVGRVDCRRWKHPMKVSAADELRARPGSTADGFIRGIRAGGELWFPTPSEAQAAARPVAQEISAVEETERNRAWGRGSVFA